MKTYGTIKFKLVQSFPQSLYKPQCQVLINNIAQFVILCKIIDRLRAENVFEFLIESYFRNGLIVNGSWIYTVQNCLEEFIAEFLNVIVDRKIFEDNLSRCVKLFRETGAFTEEKPLVSR
jgi:hypothetical protein